MSHPEKKYTNETREMRHMKVSLGMRLRDGPWGGGNQFGRVLVQHLQERGVDVFFDLTEPDLDVIVLVDPRKHLWSPTFDDRDILAYCRNVNSRSLVIHRVNECDERKDTEGVNEVLLRANRCADHTVFVSNWLRDLFLRKNLPCESYSVIRNGSSTNVFHSNGHQPCDRRRPLKIVTHHWGCNWLKGFDIYQRLDHMIETGWRGLIEFTYIGNLPDDFKFRNVRHVSPIPGDELASLLRRHHVYLTASVNEPGSHHQNEGACCGLPLLYRESGCLPEYCEGYGLSFTEQNFEQKMAQMFHAYEDWVPKMTQYPNTAKQMCQSYEDLFNRLLRNRL